jgi:hypothetical protein
MRKLHIIDLEPKMDQEEEVVELNNEEWPVSKKRKLIGENPATWTKSATKAAGGETSTFTLEDNSYIASSATWRDCCLGSWSMSCRYNKEGK